MQTLWSLVLAGEANAPGSYSKRTVNLLSSLDKYDAYLFTKLCTFLWKFDELRPLIYDFQDDIYGRHDVTYNSLQHLHAIGLVIFTPYDFNRYRIIPRNITASYYGRSIVIEPSKISDDNEIYVGQVHLTKVGQELAPICGSTADEEFLNYMLKKWKEDGYIQDNKIES